MVIWCLLQHLGSTWLLVNASKLPWYCDLPLCVILYKCITSRQKVSDIPEDSADLPDQQKVSGIPEGSVDFPDDHFSPVDSPIVIESPPLN